MNRVEELRIRLQMTQEQFAEYCSISRSSVARYEKGENISRENAEKIANACKVSIDYVLGKEEIEKKPAALSDGQREETISLLQDLTPDEIQRVRDFVSGIKSSRAK